MRKKERERKRKGLKRETVWLRGIQCVLVIDYRSKMIIFESLLITFEDSVFFEAAEELVKIGLSRKPNQHSQI